jgi:hypothetical protein
MLLPPGEEVEKRDKSKSREHLNKFLYEILRSYDFLDNDSNIANFITERYHLLKSDSTPPVPGL